MSIRFKFRSSVSFDVLEIGDRASISVWELRAKILKGKASQQQHQGFDLVFSDADSGLELKSDDCQILSGSSVIVRRVPAGTMSSAMPPVQAVRDVEIKNSHDLNPCNRPADEFDDLGGDMCLIPDSTFPDFNLEFDGDDSLGNGTSQVAGLSGAECQKQGPSDLTQEPPRGCNQSGYERIAVPSVDQQIKPIKPSTSSFPVVHCTNLPVEMKCPLCNSFFKEAVMIPCCQHSFCNHCICQVLIDQGRCPKCYSSKCRVEDLLQNLSLRQAIEHFLESEMHDAGLENALPKCVPDGESGIQARDFSYTPTVVQRELELPQSSSGTGKVSNQVYTEAFFEQRHQRNLQLGASGNRDVKSALASQKINQIDDIHHRHNDIRSGPEEFVSSTDFQGENQPVTHPTNVHYEADINTRRRGGHWIESGGGERNFVGPGGHRKASRNCYKCGSPDHLMRDCPMSHLNPIFQTGNGAYCGGMRGYAQPACWNGSSMPPFRPYPNMFGNPGMMQFNTSMVPFSPFAAATYFPPMGGTRPCPGANMRIGNMGPPRHVDHFGLLPCENKRQHPNEEYDGETISEEDDSPECYRHANPARSHDHRLHKEDKPGLTRSDDSFAQRLAGKYQHEKVSHPSNSSKDKMPSHGEKSSSGKDDASESSERRHRHHYHGESRRYHERGGNRESESSHIHHSSQKDTKIRPDLDVRGSHHSPPAARRREYRDRDADRNYSRSPARRREYRDRDADRNYSRHVRKHLREESREDRWLVGNSLERDRRDEHHHHKRRAH